MKIQGVIGITKIRTDEKTPQPQADDIHAEDVI